jgi:hypothetical protein
VEDRPDELDLLLVALAQLLGPAIGMVANPEAGEPVASPLGRLAARDAMEGSDEHELVEDLHPRIQAALLGEVAPRAARRVGGRPPSPGHRACIRMDDVENDPHRRRLAGAVRAEEAEHLAALSDKADPVERRHGAVPLAQ